MRGLETNTRGAPRRHLRALLRRVLRAALRRYLRAAPRADEPPRVVFILATAWGMGGTIRSVFNLAAHLSERYPVTIYSLRRRQEEPFFRFPPGVEVIALDDKRPDLPPPARFRRLRKRLKSMSSVLVDTADPVMDHFTVWVDLRLARRLRRRSGFLIGTRPGVNALLAELAPPGMVLVGQDHMNLSAYSEEIQEDIWRAYPALDVVVTLTERDRAAYVERLPDRPRFERIPNAARDMGPRRADLDAKLIVSAGRMTRQKGYDLLIPAFEQVLAKHPDWRLRIYGAGRERGNLRQMINERGLKDLIRLPKPVQDLGPELERASIYVLSSRFEGLPLVLIEAMSKGLAVVSTDCPTGPGDIIEDRRNGLLVPFKDVDALAAGMLELIEDGDLRRRCAAAGIETARAYAPATVGAAWDALLAEVWSARFPGR